MRRVLSTQRAWRCKTRQTLHLFADMVTLVADAGLLLHVVHALILTWGSGSCRLDTPAPTGDPSHAPGADTGS